MNSILKSTMRLSALKQLYQLKNVVTVSNQQRQITRNLWYMCNSRSNNFTKAVAVKLQSPTELCSCGCGKKGVHSKGKNDYNEIYCLAVANFLLGNCSHC